MAAEAVRPPPGTRRHRRVPQRPPQHLRILPALRGGLEAAARGHGDAVRKTAALGRRAPELLQAMAAVPKLSSLARAARETAHLPVRQPVAKVQVVVPAAVRGPALADLLDILAAEVNAKAIEVAGSDHDLVRLKGKADFRSLGKRYGKDTPRAAAAVSQLTA